LSGAARAALQKLQAPGAAPEHHPRFFPQLARLIVRTRAGAAGSGAVKPKLPLVIHHRIVPSGKTVGELARFVRAHLTSKGFVEMHVTTPVRDATDAGASNPKAENVQLKNQGSPLGP
jgi:hypothetical protein